LEGCQAAATSFEKQAMTFIAVPETENNTYNNLEDLLNKADTPEIVNR
jgi:hypothetical protein